MKRMAIGLIMLSLAPAFLADESLHLVTTHEAPPAPLQEQEVSKHLPIAV